MVYDFVHLAVGAVDDAEDNTGARTVEFLRRTRRAARLVISNTPGSLGLHPAVYFYSWTGKQQPILFLTMAEIVIDLERRGKLDEFVARRENLEQFIMAHRTLLNQIVRKFGTKDSGKGHLRAFYEKVFLAIDQGKIDAEIVETLTSDKAFTYLQPTENPYAGVSPTRYSAQVKSGLVITELLPTAPRCGICRGLVPSQAMSIDHKVDRARGGQSNIENLQFSHPYCNTGYKNAGKQLHPLID